MHTHTHTNIGLRALAVHRSARDVCGIQCRAQLFVSVCVTVLNPFPDFLVLVFCPRCSCYILPNCFLKLQNIAYFYALMIMKCPKIIFGGGEKTGVGLSRAKGLKDGECNNVQVAQVLRE